MPRRLIVAANSTCNTSMIWSTAVAYSRASVGARITGVYYHIHRSRPERRKRDSLLSQCIPTKLSCLREADARPPASRRYSNVTHRQRPASGRSRCQWPVPCSVRKGFEPATCRNTFTVAFNCAGGLISRYITLRKRDKPSRQEAPDPDPKAPVPTFQATQPHL